MKFYTMAFAALAASVLISPAFGEGGDLHFSVKNNSGKEIKELYVSHVGTDSWEDDLLGGDGIKPGEEQPITVNDGRDTCQYDLKVVDEDGTEAEARNQNLCSFDGGTFDYGG
ncbi:MAG TPA: hypothetical protein VL971_04225 [Rhizomicrobium sp.]|jgi:hypothetical protein|nr:hypothetical protein [Rhizomicrobium sp.]